MQLMAAMIVRHRLGFLLTVLAAVLVLTALRLAGIAMLSPIAFAALGVTWLGLAFGAIAALNARQAATFEVGRGAFTTPPSLNAVLMAGASTAMGATIACEMVAEAARGRGVDPILLTAVVLVVVLLPVQWWSVLGRFGLFLRPDGLLERQPFGSIFIPWEAGAAAEATPYGVRLRLARPDLIVRRGLRPGTSVRTGADRGFTAWAVNVYAARTDLRPTIGTEEGLLRLGIDAG